jgi:hypothetical protein
MISLSPQPLKLSLSPLTVIFHNSESFTIHYRQYANRLCLQSIPANKTHHRLSPVCERAARRANGLCSANDASGANEAHEANEANGEDDAIGEDGGTEENEANGDGETPRDNEAGGATDARDANQAGSG